MDLDFSLRGLLAAAVRTVRDPRSGAEAVMATQIAVPALWMMMVVLVAASVVISQLGFVLTADMTMSGIPGVFFANPLLLWAVQFGSLVIVVYAVHHIGRAMGGVGSFEDGLALLVWLQFVRTCLKVVETGVFLISPETAALVSIAAILLYLWLGTHFVAVLHRFESLGLVFVMILLSGFGILFAISLVLSMTGIISPGDTNV